MNNIKIKRIIESKIEKLLKFTSCILIYGPKMSGKTFVAKNFSKSWYFVQELGEENNKILKANSKIILDGDKPRLIDEWQIIPKIWDKIRYLIDKNEGKSGQYILTGSSTLNNKKDIIHSGAGRITRIKMDTLTYSEISKQEDIINFKDLIILNKWNTKK